MQKLTKVLRAARLQETRESLATILVYITLDQGLQGRVINITVVVG